MGTQFNTYIRVPALIMTEEETEMKQRLDRFMKEFHELAPNPFNSLERIWKDKALFSVMVFDGAIRLSNIRAMEPRRRGHGSEALDWFVALARKHGVRVTGFAMRTGEVGAPRLGKVELKAWYARHGFAVGKKGQLLFDGSL